MKPFLKHVSKTIVNSSCYITPNIAWLWMGGTGWHVTNSRLSNISLLVWIRVLALLTHSEEIYWQVKSWHTEVSGDCITHWAVQDVLEIVTSPGLALRVQCRAMVLLLSPAWPYSLLNRIKETCTAVDKTTHSLWKQTRALLNDLGLMNISEGKAADIGFFLFQFEDQGSKPWSISHSSTWPLTPTRKKFLVKKSYHQNSAGKNNLNSI